MSFRFRHIAAAAMVAVALAGAACEPGLDRPLPIEPGLESKLLGDVVDDLLEPVQRGWLSEQTAGEIIGIEGGTLELLGHSITVPPGAVLEPTLFIMIALAGEQIEVELLAVDPETGVDVGGKGFLEPVQLALSYADADVSDEDSLVIVRVHPDGTREELDSKVDKDAKVVRADLDHFSRYMLCGN